MIKASDLPSEVVELGILSGLLIPNGDQLDLNFQWFENPLAADHPSLANIGTRLDHLVSFISSRLQPAPVSPAVFDGARWFSIAGSGQGGASPFCVVTGGNAPTGQMGLGLLHTLQEAGFEVAFSAYLPMVTYAPSGLAFIAASHPIVLGVRLSPTGGGRITANDVTFAAVSLDANIHLDPAAYAGDPSFVALKFEDLKSNAQKPDTYTRLSDVLGSDVPSWLGALFLQGTWIRLYIGHTPYTIGDILVGGNLLTCDDAGQYHLHVDWLSSQKPLDILLQFLFGVLDNLASSSDPYPILNLPGGGLYFSRRDDTDGGADYGVRLAMERPLGAGGSGKDPVLTATLGTWFSEETDADNWYMRSSGAAPDKLPEPGVLLYLIHADQNLNVSFQPSFSLSSVGIDIARADESPLINVAGTTLHGAELRFYLDSSWTYGAACKLDRIGLPLGAQFGSMAGGSASNPVAQSLVQSGAGGGKPGDQDPVNPAFSASAAYVHGGTFAVRMFDKDGLPAPEVTIPLHRALGPLQCEKLGIGWVDEKVSLLFDGGIELASLHIDLKGLSVGIPVTTPADFSRYSIDLQGIDLSMSNGGVELSSALVKLPADPPTRPYVEYDGEALIKAERFAISAFGSYAYIPATDKEEGYASLFVFAVETQDLGGPEFFHVRGLAAGFGYNRALILPEVDAVTTFPLVAAASDPGKLGAEKQADGSWKTPTPVEALAKLSAVAPPQRGEYWFAAGVRFTSYDLIHSTALVTVEFGNELEIAVLGDSWISLPPPASPDATNPPDQKYAYGELGIEVKILPSEGLFSATAILTPNSFVLDPACRLTGGFAFFVWFGSNPHAGDFVLTLGGYHPDFPVPAHYPNVPRLGFRWPVSGDLLITGEAYFALTPSAVMAGARLEVLFSSGDLRAWFKAHMDALIIWSPFHYVIGIGVSVGASFRINLLFVSFTITIELGAELTIWGPRMGGRADINWYIISFSVYFGADQTDRPPPLPWHNPQGTGFAQTLLPATAPKPSERMTRAADNLLSQAPAGSTLARVAAMAAFETAPTEAAPSRIYTVMVNDGLLKTFTGPQGETIWLVRPNHFTFSILTAFPATEIDIATPGVGGTDSQTKIDARNASHLPDYTVWIRPMRATLASSVFSIKMRDDDYGKTYDLADLCDYTPACHSVPAAKWGKPLDKGQDPEPNELLPGRLLGIENIMPKPPVLSPAGDALLEIDVPSAFTYDVVDKDDSHHLPLAPAPDVTAPVPDAKAEVLLAIIKAGIMSDKTVKARSDIYSALVRIGVTPGTDGRLDALNENPGGVLVGNPLVFTPQVAAQEARA
jgi:hypothetical protein